MELVLFGTFGVWVELTRTHNSLTRRAKEGVFNLTRSVPWYETVTILWYWTCIRQFKKYTSDTLVAEVSGTKRLSVLNITSPKNSNFYTFSTLVRPISVLWWSKTQKKEREHCFSSKMVNNIRKNKPANMIYCQLVTVEDNVGEAKHGLKVGVSK